MAYTPNQYLTTITGNATWVVPAGYYIKYISIENTTANAVTGGIKIGTTSGGLDVLGAFAVGANALTVVGDASLLKRLFSTSVDTTLFIQAVTAWNSASLNISVELGKHKQ